MQLIRAKGLSVCGLENLRVGLGFTFMDFRGVRFDDFDAVSGMLGHQGLVWFLMGGHMIV